MKRSFNAFSGNNFAFYANNLLLGSNCVIHLSSPKAKLHFYPPSAHFFAVKIFMEHFCLFEAETSVSHFSEK